MTIVELLSQPEKKNKHVLKMLLMHYLWINKEQLVTEDQTIISDGVLSKIEKDYNRFVIDKEPLEYILGYVEFDQRRFFVDKRNLIPRPETEYMIEAVKEYMQSLKGKKCAIVDVWTGCGVLGISSFLNGKGILGDMSHLYMMDISEECLEVATINVAKHLSTKEQHMCTIVQSNLLAYPVEHDVMKDHDATIVVANLPYIPDELFDTQAEDNVKLWEPRMAFVWGNDWLDYYREMFGQMIPLVSPLQKGDSWFSKLVMFLEMMTWQVEILEKEFGDILVFEEVKTFHFQIRIVKAWFR